MELVTFTRAQREKLQRLGYYNCYKNNAVKSGEGCYTKQIGKVYLSIHIRDHKIKRFAFSLPYQGTDLDFAQECLSNISSGLKEIKALKYFEKVEAE